MKAMLIIGTFEAFFLLLLILSKRQKRMPDLFLGFIFFTFGLSIGFTWLELYNADNGYPLPWALNTSWLFLFLHGPGLWLYIKSLSISGFRFRRVYLLHFVPFVVFFVIHWITFYSLEPSTRIQLVVNDSFQGQLFYKLSVIGVGLSTLTYYLWGLKQIRDRRRRLMNNFSRIDNKDLEWLRILIIVSLVVYGVNVALFNLDLVVDIAPYRTLMLFAYCFASLYILVLGFFGLQQGNVFLSAAVEPATQKPEIGKPPLRVKDEKSDFINRLLRFMEDEKPFLAPEMTLARLASMLNVGPEFLSSVLNHDLDHSFFDFVNKYRVEEFKLQALSEENSHLSIMGIAYECGFNSKAAFYRAFRRYENQSPSDYIARLRKK